MTEPPEQPPDDERDDEFVLALARHARGSQWEELAHGRMSVEDAQRERKAAGDSDELIERASAYFRPFDADEQASLIDLALGAVSKPATAEVIPMRPRAAANSRWVFVAAAVAIAAAVSLWWMWPPREPGSGGVEIARVDLPHYSVETEGGLKQVRDSSGEPDAVLHYRRETAFEWVLRPDTAVAGEVDVRGFVFREPAAGGRAIDLTKTAEIGKSGAIRIRGKIGDLGLETGDHVIALVIGRSGELPESIGGFAELERGGWQVARIELVVED